MGELVLTDAKVWAGGYDLSGDANALSLANVADVLDNTTFGQTGRRRLTGLRSADFGLSGRFNAGGGTDSELFEKIGLNAVPMTFAAEGGQDAELGWLGHTVHAEYAPGASVGEILRFEANGNFDDELVRGTIMHNATRTATGNGVARQLGAVSATERVFASLHVTGVSGTLPTLDGVIESDDNSAMTSATTRLTFTQATAITGELLRSLVGSAITDDWWRIRYTIGGTTPSFDFVCAIGIR